MTKQIMLIVPRACHRETGATVILPDDLGYTGDINCRDRETQATSIGEAMLRAIERLQDEAPTLPHEHDVFYDVMFAKVDEVGENGMLLQ